MALTQIKGSQVQDNTIAYGKLLSADIETTLVGAGSKLASASAIKTYVDSVASGLDPKASVRLATIAALPAVTASGTGVGKTLTADAVGVVTIDGQAVTAANGYNIGDRILVKNQVATVDNGIYTVTTLSAAGAALVLTRATDSDGTPSNEVSLSNYVFVEGGSLAASGWVLSSSDDTTLPNLEVDVDTQVWTQFNAATSYTASNGLTLSGNDFQLNFTGLTDTAAATGDSLVFIDASDSNNEKKRLISSFLTDLDIRTGNINLTSQVTGILPVANGGTGVSTIAANLIPFGNGTSAIQTDTAFRFDDTTLSGQTAHVVTLGDATNYYSGMILKASTLNVITGLAQTAATTNSIGLFIGSGEVSGATSSSGAVQLQSGNSTTSGNTGAFLITTGDATSGDSGILNLRTGAASGTVGYIQFTIGGAGGESVGRINATGFDLGTGNSYQINGTSVLSATALGSAVVSSSLTSVGTLTSGATGAGFTVALGTSTITGVLTATNGGTGLATLTANKPVIGNGTSAVKYMEKYYSSDANYLTAETFTVTGLATSDVLWAVFINGVNQDLTNFTISATNTLSNTVDDPFSATDDVIVYAIK